MCYVDACISIDRYNYENPQKRHHGRFVNSYAASVPPSNSIIHLSISKLEVEFQINILMLLCMIRLDLANCSKLMEMTTCIYLVNHHSWFIIRRFQKLSCATCCVFRFTFMHIYNHIYTRTYVSRPTQFSWFVQYLRKAHNFHPNWHWFISVYSNWHLYIFTIIFVSKPIECSRLIQGPCKVHQFTA